MFCRNLERLRCTLHTGGAVPVRSPGAASLIGEKTPPAKLCEQGVAELLAIKTFCFVFYFENVLIRFLRWTRPLLIG